MKSERHGKSKILTPTEQQQLLEALAPKYQTLLRLLMLTGFRIGEALSLKVENLGASSILVRKCSTKGRKQTREIPLPPEMVAQLRQLKNSGDYLFESSHKPGHPLTRQAVDYIFRNTCKQLGIEGFSLHGTRRFFIHTLAHKNTPLRVIQEAVGHSSLRTTTAYIDVEEHHIKTAVSQLWALV